MLGSNLQLYTVIYEKVVQKHHIPDLPSNMRDRVRESIEQHLLDSPERKGKPLTGSFRGHRRLRVGDYRVIYRIDPAQKIVYVVAIKHRREAYRH